MHRLLPLLLVSGCGGEVTSSANRIALAADFQDYETWEFIALPAVDGGTEHSAQARTVFINKRPHAGSTEFPVGTLIVKEMPFSTLAMSKRGGTYNANGAKGWEWFNLERHASDAVVIVWRGLGPPLGEAYGESSASCNDCHKARIENDSVLTPELGLH